MHREYHMKGRMVTLIQSDIRSLILLEKKNNRKFSIYRRCTAVIKVLVCQRRDLSLYVKSNKSVRSINVKYPFMSTNILL